MADVTISVTIATADDPDPDDPNFQSAASKAALAAEHAQGALAGLRNMFDTGITVSGSVAIPGTTLQV